jgi:hypothetical protein
VGRDVGRGGERERGWDRGKDEKRVKGDGKRRGR